MTAHLIRSYLARVAVACLLVTGAVASEHHGTVKSGALPLPGATVTATQGDKKVVTTTDERGVYSFADLADGIWTIRVELLGFGPVSRDVAVAAESPSPDWQLRFQSLSEIVAAMAKPQTTAPAGAPAAPPAPGAPAAAAAVNSAPPAPAAETQQRNGRQQAQANGRQQAQSGRGRQGQNQQQNAEFQQVGVNQSADISIFGEEGAITSEMNAELSQSANQAYVLQGSMSGALGMQGMNDWGPPGGPGMGPGFGIMGMGGPEGMGPGGIPGMPGMPGVAAEGQSGAVAQGGAPGGGRGGPGGGPGGGGPMMGGGPGGGGGPMMGGGGRGGFGGGPMMGGGGRGGRGGEAGGRGAAAGRGGPAWQGRPNALAFGNNRRNPRMMYNGSLSIQERNSILNARDYSLTGQNIAKPYSNNTNVNASFGGPLRIPKLLTPSNSRMGQFTLTVGIGRNRRGNSGSLTTMPSALEREGDFSQSVGSNGGPVVAYDPSTGAPFPGNRIPSNVLSPIATALLKYYPMPNLPGASRNYQRPYTTHSNTNSINARINQTLDQKNRVNFGIGYQGSDNNNPTAIAFIDPETGLGIVNTGTGRGMNINLSYSHNFASRLIGTLNYTFSRNRSLSSPYFANRTDIASELGIQGVSTDPLNWGPPSLNFSTFGDFNAGNASLTRSQTSSVTASLMWVHKTHNMSFGASFRRQQDNRESDSNGRGSFTFNGYATSLLVDKVDPATGLVTKAAQAGTGFELADFLLGTPDTATVRYGNPSLYFRGSVYSLYMQDDWRLAPRFSVNFGIRWDYQTPIIELNNNLVNLAFTPAFTSYTTVLPGQSDAATGKRYSRTLLNSDPNNIAPRFGFAWRPSSRSTVIRGGYGLYFNSSVYSSVSSQLSQQPPMATAWALYIQDGPMNMATAFANPSSRGTSTIKNTFAIDPNYKIGYAQQWNFSVQHSLPLSLQTTVSYIGTKGTNLDRRITPWVTPPGAAAAPYPTGYTYETYGGNSIYNAGSVQLNRRFRAGLMASANYTFQKGIDSGTTAQNWLDFRAERAVNTRPHSLNINFSYSTGQGRRGGGLLTGWRAVLVQDWSISSTIAVSSGNWLTVTSGGNQFTRGGGTRADATGLPVSDAPAGWYFNPAAFSIPAAGTWGNAGRNVVPGPTNFSLGAQASRSFRLGERRRATFSINATNALNTVVVTGWNTTLNTANFGQPTSVSGMRQVNTSLRFNF